MQYYEQVSYLCDKSNIIYLFSLLMQLQIISSISLLIIWLKNINLINDSGLWYKQADFIEK